MSEPIPDDELYEMFPEAAALYWLPREWSDPDTNPPKVVDACFDAIELIRKLHQENARLRQERK